MSILVVAVTLFILDIARVHLLVKKGKILAKNAIPFERANLNAQIKILVIGDSTAMGTGSKKPELTTAGRLGTLYPEASVKNISQNGLKLGGLLKILETLDSQEHFSIILVQIGSNDIIRLTNMKDIEKDAEKVFARLSKQTDKLIVLHSGDIGRSRLFPIYIRPILTKRSFKVREIYKKLANKYGSRYVDLISAPSDKLFSNDPHTYYSKDMLHLNAAGYGLWFMEIQKNL